VTVNHNQLGFSNEMPGTTGEVQVVTPAQEQLAELRERAFRRAETAGNLQAALDTLPGDLDEHLGDLIDDAARARKGPEGYEESVIADEVGARALMHGEDLDETAIALSEQPVAPLGEALQDIAVTEGDDAAKKVARKIDEVTRITVYEDVVDNLTPAMRELADIYGNSGHLEVLPNAPIPEVFGTLDKKLRGATYPFGDDLNLEVRKLCDEAKKQFYETAVTEPKSADRMITALYDAYVVKAKSDTLFSRKIYEEISPEPLQPIDIDARARDDVLIGRELNSLFTDMPVDVARAIRELPESQRKKYDALCEQYLNRDLPIYANGETVGYEVAKNEIVRAHLEGFATLTDKYHAVEDGTIPVPENGHPTKLDIFCDFLDDTTDEQYQSWSHEFLRDELHLPPGISSELLVAAMGRSRWGENNRAINPSLLFGEMEQIQKSVEKIGVENVRKLRDKCGIVNIHQLSNEQATRMIQFADGDPRLAETLQDKEVCVVIRDATADWNGALSGVNADFETTDGATLIFEISDLGDPHQLKMFTDSLQRRGIRASALVISGHGSPGKIQMGSTYLNFRPEFSPNGQYLPEEVGLNTLLKTMKPDRDGNCSVIFASCSQAANIRDDFDSSLTRLAQLAHTEQPDATFQMYGVEKPGSLRFNGGQGGNLYDNMGQHVEHVITSSSGKIYQLGRYKEVTIPMFAKTNIDERIAA